MVLQILSSTSQQQIKKFMADQSIRSMQLCKKTGLQRVGDISHVTAHCIREVDDPRQDYPVTFKLCEGSKDIADYLCAIDTQPDITVTLGPMVSQCSAQALTVRLDDFLQHIGGRLAEAKKEQDIQSIQFVGNRFILNNAISFDVLDDDGEGNLTIDIIGDKMTSEQKQELRLSSHGLLDGLYLGSIKLVDSD